ncbi:MAG: HAMP domain-containing histidine kinase, partial [Armatimonadetes bacterium]|nr:HAMP domain-containing histidine kinase [Armatimonadota bacterium]
RYDEIKRLTVAFNEMAAALQRRDEDLRKSHEDLARSAEELKRWNQNYLDTLEFITHQLKNQVAAMKINLLAVRDGYVGDLSQEQKEALDDVVAAVNRTEEMILNYLNLSRIEKGELEVRARPVHVEAEVLRPVLRDTKPRFDDRGMRVDVDLPEDLVVQADPSLLQIVYDNLLTNAAKYGREGGLVRVWGRRSDGYVELHVWNEGEGVPRDEIDNLFRKFTRLQTGDNMARGTGLGLFIAREIARAHGGDIRAETEPGQWIDFIITLPRPDVILG